MLLLIHTGIKDKTMLVKGAPGKTSIYQLLDLLAHLMLTAKSNVAHSIISSIITPVEYNQEQPELTYGSADCTATPSWWAIENAILSYIALQIHTYIWQRPYSDDELQLIIFSTEEKIISIRMYNQYFFHVTCSIIGFSGVCFLR